MLKVQIMCVCVCHAYEAKMKIRLVYGFLTDPVLGGQP